MNFGNLLYWASQFPPEICGIVLLLFIAVASAVALLIPKSRVNYQYWAIWFDYRKTLYICIGLFLFTLLQAVLLPYSLNLMSVLNAGFYLILYGASNKSALNLIPMRSIATVTWLNLALLVGSFLMPIREITFIEVVGGARFQSIYTEPSYAAFIYILNLQQLMMRRSEERSYILIAINISCLLITYSGSGFSLLLLLILTSMSSKISIGGKIKYFALLVAISLLLLIFAGDAINQIVTSRWIGILNGEIDNSVFLRFVAPWIFLDGLASESIHFFIGAGIGGITEYINFYRAELGYLVFFDGAEASALNNGYAVIIALLGFPLGFGVLSWIFFRVWKSKSDVTYKVLFIGYPFFSGWVIHPLFFLLMALTLWRQPLMYSNSRVEVRNLQ